MEAKGLSRGGCRKFEEAFKRFLLGLQEGVAAEIDCREKIVSFILEYFAYLMYRLSQGEDGKVPMR